MLMPTFARGHSRSVILARAGALSLALGIPGAAPICAQEIPSPSEFFGLEAGERFTDFGSVQSYAEALAAASEQVELHRYGVTPEGRPLLLLVLSRAGTLNQVDRSLESLARLTEPDLPAGDASEIARGEKAVVWFTYGVHGDESSSTEAALWTAWDLASGTNGSSGILDSLIVVIDPAANPDGRDRYVQWYRTVRGAEPNSEPSSAEHDQPWPGGRFNHYLFDLNRDWTWASQPETRARLAAFGRWRPAVHVDFHEMEPGSTYFFFPAASPVNPIYPEYTLDWAAYFGRENAREFDRRRWLYYTEERFDLFYPGYGDTWPSLVGAIGMTYEQAGGGGAGLAVRRADGSILTLADRLEHHRVAGLTTLRAAAARKSDLLLDYAEFHRSLREGYPDVLLVPGEQPEALDALSATLLRQGIEVERAAKAFEARASPHAGFDERDEFPEGTLLVRSAQPRGRLAVTLLQPETLHPETGSNRTYDITAWSLPYAFGVEAHTASGSIGAKSFEPLTQPPGSANRDVPDQGPSPIGWLVPPSLESVGPLYRWLSAAGRAVALETEFVLDGRRWPPGTRFVMADSGSAGRLIESGLDELAVPVNSGLTEEGRDLGTPWSVNMRPVRIGVFRGRGIWPTSFGAAWYFLEQIAEIPFDALDLSEAAGLDLSKWDVLVVPDGAPGRSLDERATQAIDTWLRAGGTLVVSAGSARWASGEFTDIEARSAEVDSLPPEERRQRALLTRSEKRLERWDRAVSGVILPVQADRSHPLAWGVGLGNTAGREFVLHIADLSFEPSDAFETVISFEQDLQAVSGVMSDAKLEEMSSSSWLATATVGDGRIVLFADDPLFRLMWPSQFILFANALLLGPVMR